MQVGTGCRGKKSGPLWLVCSEGGRGSLYAGYARSEILRCAQNDKGEWVGALVAYWLAYISLDWSWEDDDQSLWQGHQRYPVPPLRVMSFEF